MGGNHSSPPQVVYQQPTPPPPPQVTVLAFTRTEHTAPYAQSLARLTNARAAAEGNLAAVREQRVAHSSAAAEAQGRISAAQLRQTNSARIVSARTHTLVTTVRTLEDKEQELSAGLASSRIAVDLARARMVTEIVPQQELTDLVSATVNAEQFLREFTAQTAELEMLLVSSAA